MIRPRDIVRDWAERGLLHTLTPVDLVVLWDVADRAGRTGRAYESARAIADRYGWHYRTVRRSFDRIEATGIARVHRRPGVAATVVFSTGESVHSPAPMSAGSHADQPGEVVHNPAPTSARSCSDHPAPMSANPAPYGAQPRADERAEHREQRKEHRAHARETTSSPYPINGAAGADIAKQAAHDERHRLATERARA